MQHHECPSCRQTKPITDFYEELGACRACKKNRMRNYRTKKKHAPHAIKERIEHVPLPCEILYECERIQAKWSPRVERARAVCGERPVEVEAVSLGGFRRR